MSRSGWDSVASCVLYPVEGVDCDWCGQPVADDDVKCAECIEIEAEADAAAARYEAARRTLAAQETAR